MITVIPPPPGKLPCKVFVMVRRGLTAIDATTWCNVTYDAGKGLMQLPDATRCCEACESALKAYQGGA